MKALLLWIGTYVSIAAIVFFAPFILNFALGVLIELLKLFQRTLGNP